MLSLLTPILPELVFFVAGCLALLLDVFHVLKRTTVFVCLCCCVLGFFAIALAPSGVFFYELVQISAYSQMVKCIVLILLLMQVLSASSSFEKYITNSSEYLGMLFFVLLGVCIMVSSYNLITLYVGLEIQALSAYTLILMQKKSHFSAESGLKYFILGSLASVVYLFGVSFIYGSVGAIDFQTIAKAPLSTLYVGAPLVLCAFLFKVGAVPFHQWLPDVYQGAPTPVTSALATIVKLGSLCVLLLLIYIPFKHFFSPKVINPLLTLIGAASMILGASVAIVQKYLKRLLAYSSIYHLGFVCLGLLNVTNEGMSFVIFYLVFYSLTLMMVFICLISLKDKPNRENRLDDLHINELRGLAEVRPKHAFVLSLGLLSLAGVPPLFGFLPKLMLFKYALSQGAVVLFVVALITTAVSLYYVLKVIKAMYMEPPFSIVFLPSQKLNYRLIFTLLPVLLMQIFGAYVPLTEFLYEKYILASVNEVVVYENEKNYTHSN